MKILFDHNLNRRVVRYLPGIDIRTAKQMGWNKLENGNLLEAAAGAAFDAVLTIDKNIRHEQNLRTLPLPVVVLDCMSSALPSLIPFAPFVLSLLNQPLAKGIYVIDLKGIVTFYDGAST